VHKRFVFVAKEEEHRFAEKATITEKPVFES